MSKLLNLSNIWTSYSNPTRVPANLHVTLLPCCDGLEYQITRCHTQ